MSDDENPYPERWLNESQLPHENDPRLGTVLEPWQPTAAQQARVVDLLLLYLCRSQSFAHPFLMFCSDIYDNKLVPQMMLAMFEFYVTTALSGEAEALAVRRLAGQLGQLHKTAREEFK